MFLNIFVDVFHVVGSSPLKQLTDGSIFFTLFQFTIYNRFVGLSFMTHVKFPTFRQHTDPATTL